MVCGVDVTVELVLDEGVWPNLDAAGSSQTATAKAMANRMSPPTTLADLRSYHSPSLCRPFFVALLLVCLSIMSQGIVYDPDATTAPPKP